MPVDELRLTPVGDHGSVSAAVHRPRRPRGAAFLLVHGAGGAYDSPSLVALAAAIAGEGHLVVRSNLPYREAGRRAPPRADRSVAPFAAIATAARAAVGPRRPWVVGGKSFGGRVASMAVAEAAVTAAGLLFYGYPLHPPGRPDALRTHHWPAIGVPCLFLQGSRDAFADPGLLESNLRRLPGPSTVHVVEGGDHSLRVARAASSDGRAHPAEEVVGGLGPLIAAWGRGLT